jgi:ribonucleoside-diphosphate reductase alpha chain
VYKLAWLRGLKTTYYCRTLGASDAEKSTVSRSSLNAVKAHNEIAEVTIAAPVCPIDDPTCEACQ